MFVSEHFPWADWPSTEASSSLSCGPPSKDRLSFRCRICHCEGDDESPLITPCHCTGSLHFVHQTCLQQWIKSSDTRCCELCKYEFIMETKLKPLRKVRAGPPLAAVPSRRDELLKSQRLGLGGPQSTCVHFFRKWRPVCTFMLLVPISKSPLSRTSSFWPFSDHVFVFLETKTACLSVSVIWPLTTHRFVMSWSALDFICINYSGLASN